MTKVPHRVSLFTQSFSFSLTNMAELPSFALPTIQDNEFGWGPSDIPTQFKDIPFAPFNKNDRLGQYLVSIVLVSFLAALTQNTNTQVKFQTGPLKGKSKASEEVQFMI